jgi:thiol-disulfide isomerase/thioredoxin
VLTFASAAAGCGGGGAAVKRGKPLELVFEPIDGGTIGLAEMRGRVVVLHVFAGWSLAAQADVPQLVELARGEPRVAVVGIGLDPEGRQVLAPWRDANAIPYLIVAADHVTPAFETTPVVPTTIVLDREGREAARIERGLADGELAKVVQRVLE